jgi:hypothetical protein
VRDIIVGTLCFVFGVVVMITFNSFRVSKCERDLAAIQSRGVETVEKLVPVIVKDNSEDKKRTDKLATDIAEIAKEEPTDACADSAALERRRLQLCAAEGGPDCPQ